MFFSLKKFFRGKPNAKAQPTIGWEGILHKLEQKEPVEQTIISEIEAECELESQISSDCLFIMNTELLRLVLRHIRTVVTKYEQAIYSDDYGNIELDEATKQLDYFLNKTLRNGLLATTLPLHISRESYIHNTTIFLDNLNHLNSKRDLIEKFINVSNRKDFEDSISAISCSHIGHMMGASEKTLHFIFGENYEQFYHLLRDELNNIDYEIVVENVEVQVAHDFVTNNLISPQDLSNLKKWFCDRHEYKATLADIKTGQEFELFCKKCLENVGWGVRTTRATGDFGADLVAERLGSTVIIQCKYYSQPIGVKAVQEAFSAMKFYNAHKAAVVSNQSYTKAARQMAQKNNVMLLHVDELDRL